MLDLLRTSGATFSPCRRWRYELWRQWDASLPTILFLMLNPSIADETGVNDPTVERCERRAVNWGYGRLEVRNLFALVSTDPKGLTQVDDPIGPDNDAAILSAARRAKLVICAWGKDGLMMGRGAAVSKMLRAEGIDLFALRITPKTLQPQHPLYLPYAATPIPYPG